MRSSNGSFLVQWTDSNGAKQSGWGGSNGSSSCACGKEKKCAKPTSLCNCDISDNTWRSDSGLLSRKTSLPATELKFSDISAKKFGKFYLGALLCENRQFSKST